MVNLRDYQESVYKGVQDKIRAGFHKILVVMPCRTGKSYIFSKMAEQASERGGNTLILIHRHELRDQHEKLIHDLNVKNTEVGMVITESHHTRANQPTVIITDEAHLSMAKTYQTVISKYPDAYVIGFTATPVRLDGKPLGEMYECMVEGPTVKWAIENGFMSDFNYYAPVKFELSGLQKARGDYTEKSMEAVMMSDTVRAIYSDVIKSWSELAGNKQTIVYCVTIKHAEEMASRFTNAGYHAEAVSSNTPDNERDRIFADFRTGKLQILCNVGIISEGVTFDNVWCCLLLRPTMSHALYWQQAMRCMTYVDGKKAIILDCVKNCERLPMLDDEIIWSINEKPKQKHESGSCSMKICEECYQEVPVATKICPFCGADLSGTPDGTEIKELKNYNLELLDRKNHRNAAENASAKRLKIARQARQQKDMANCKTYSDFLRLATKYGYKSGWAYFQWRKRCES